ncbi:MarR family transcriptional regulator [Vibrio harveyi]|nr:MarR family transcriptional regulator [Vibrio harveyi]
MTSKQVAEQWLSINQELDGNVIELVTLFVRFGTSLSDARSHFCKKHGLNPSEFDVLATLYRSGEPYELTAKALKEQTLLPSSGALSNRLERLEAKELVVRKHDLVDKRSVKISLSKQGLALVAAMGNFEFFGEMATLFAALPNEQRQSLLSLMSSLQS